MKNLIGFIVFFCVFIAMLAIGMGLVFFYDQQPRSVPDQQISIKPLDSFKIYNLVNDYRAKNNLQRLSWNPNVCDFAKVRLSQIHSDMSHNGFDPEFKKYYNSYYEGENLINASQTEEDQVNAWINSPEHKANILNQNYTETCVASDFFDGQYFTVQEFASDLNGNTGQSQQPQIPMLPPCPPVGIQSTPCWTP